LLSDTGGDSHTRFLIGISLPAGSVLLAFAAATGVMPLDMPESVLVCFKDEMQPGITLLDLVNTGSPTVCCSSRTMRPSTPP
jgi:aconitate hydratase 2 / 2-methylisocitrate dehydratase